MKKVTLHLINSQNEIFEFKKSYFMSLCQVTDFPHINWEKKISVANTEGAAVAVCDFLSKSRAIPTEKYRLFELFDSETQAHNFVEYCKDKLAEINKYRLIVKKGKKFGLSQKEIDEAKEKLLNADLYIVNYSVVKPKEQSK